MMSPPNCPSAFDVKRSFVVTVNWSVENDSDIATARMDEMKNRKIEVEMP